MKLPTKAVILAAGLGTRFLPQTKAMPKEMLPIIDRPVVQLVAEEAVAAGITDIIIVTGSTKRAIEDHFDRSYELEQALRDKGKVKLAVDPARIAHLANFVYVRQKGMPLGNARPVINAMHLLSHDEPFFVFFADDFFRSEVPRAVQLLEVYKQTGKSVIALANVGRQHGDKYGMVAISQQDGRTVKIDQLIEKPGSEHAPSDYASVGGYLLTPDILPLIAQENIGSNGEITLADSINELAQTDEVYGCDIDGIWHDTGNQLMYLKALVDHALTDERMHDEFRAYLSDRLSSKT